MNTPLDPNNNPRLWARHQAHAANLLPGNFADNILRAARQTGGAREAGDEDAIARSGIWRFFHNPFALSALTACACFLAVVVIHTQVNNQANEENLAGWRNIAAQIDSIDPL